MLSGDEAEEVLWEEGVASFMSMLDLLFLFAMSANENAGLTELFFFICVASIKKCC